MWLREGMYALSKCDKNVSRDSTEDKICANDIYQYMLVKILNFHSIQ